MSLKFKDLIGMTLTAISGEVGDGELRMTASDGRVFVLNHHQDCCESVAIESIVGDLSDLIGEPILVAEECEGQTPADFNFGYEPDSYTWTFYKLATRKGYVDVRWLGTSNGYYSESVSFGEVTQ